MKKHKTSLFLPLLIIFILFSCGKAPEYYNELYFKGKQEKNEKILQKGFEKADPYFSQLCATELCDLLPKQKALEIARKATKKYPESDKMTLLLLNLLYDQRDYPAVLSVTENLKNQTKNQEILRYHYSAKVKSAKISNIAENQDLWNEIQNWYKENSFSSSHNKFYNEFSSKTDFGFATKARQLCYLGYTGKAATLIENEYETKEDFCTFLSSLSYVELTEIADIFVTGSSDKLKYSEFFARGGLDFSDSSKSFYCLFSAGRLSEKVLGSTLENLEYYRLALYLAPEISFDRALWYYTRGCINYSLEAGYKAFLEYSNAWKDPYYFDDVVEKFSASLLSKYQWETYYELFSIIYPYLSPVSRGKTDYIFGTLFENGLLFGETNRDLAKNYYEKSFVNPETEAYYRILSGVKLKEELIFENKEFVEDRDNLTSVEKHFLYLINNDIKSVNSFYLNNQSDIRESLALEAVLALEEAGKESNNFYALGLRLATAAISKEENVKFLYPRYFSEYVETFCEKFQLPEYVLYALIRTESYFDPSISSSAGAVGLCQLMPGTAGDVAKKLKYEEYNLKDPETSILFGSFYLGDLTSRSEENLLLALCSYNAGRENVRRWREKNPSLPIDVFIETIPFEETRNYGRKLIKASTIYGMLYYQLSPSEVLSEMGVFSFIY